MLQNNSNKKRLLVFTHDAVLYGASRSLLDLLSVIVKKSNIELLVVLPEDGPLVKKIKDLNIPFKIIPYPRNVISSYKKSRKSFFFYYKKVKNYFLITRNVWKQSKSFNPDIIYTNTSVIYWGALISLLKGKKHIWHIRELKGAYNCHHELGFKFFLTLLKKSKHIVCNSKAVISDYKLEGKKNTTLVYNGLFYKNDANSLFIEKKNIKKETLLVGLVGAIHPLKGQLEVLETLSLFSKEKQGLKIFIVGGINDTGYYSRICRFIDEHDIKDRVVFTGFIEEIDEYFAAFDMLICGSHSEAFGRVIIEAMVRGVIVIARNTGGIPEIIQPYINGLLYSNNEELVQCIRWVETNFNEVQRIKQTAFETAKENFNIEKYSEEIVQLLLD